MDTHDFGNDAIRASVTSAGAELTSLRFADGREMLWQAGPEWPRHAPILFPIVGRLVDDTLVSGAFRGRMTQHGFARNREFRFLERTDSGCTLELRDDEATRASYPFAFRLVLSYEIHDTTLEMSFAVENPGDAVLPASLGAHPAFRWPLVEHAPKMAHVLELEREESGPVRQLKDGLLLPDDAPSPFTSGSLVEMTAHTFDHDAIIIERVESREVTYKAPGTGGPAIIVGWDGFSTLGLWSKPADFVCIEPWSGYASPVDFTGDIADKPGIEHIAPGDTLRRSMTITLHDHG